MNCQACSEPTLSDESVFICTLCKGTYHLICGGVTESSYRRLSKERRTQLKCSQCLCAVPAMKASGSALVDTELLSKLLEQNTQILATLAAMSKQYEDILHRVHDLEATNSKLEKRNSDLEMRIDVLENQMEKIDRQNKSKNVEIRGIPEINGENLNNYIFNIRKITNSHNESNNIDAAYRINQKSKKDQRRPIVVKFKTSIDRDDFLRDIKNYNKQAPNREDKLNTSLIGIAGPSSQIYISEHLTFRAKHLWFLARKATHENWFKFAWTKGGQVYVRKDNGTPAIIINETNKNILSPSINNQ